MEATRLGLTLNIIPPAGAAGTGLKRAAQTTPASQKSTSHFKGVCWHNNKWKAFCGKTHLGVYTTEEEAAQAYNIEAARLGRSLNVIRPAGAAGAVAQQKFSSQFRGVNRVKDKNSWRAHCRGVSMGSYNTEEGAAKAYNVEAARLGLTLNIITPAGAEGAKRAAPKTQASQKNKKVKLEDTSSAAAGTAGSAGAGGVMRVTPAQWAKLEARVYAFQNRGKGYS